MPTALAPTEIWTAHSGRHVPVAEMAAPHLEHALAKLRIQEDSLVRILAGLDPDGVKSFRAGFARISPAVLPEEILIRTRHWIEILQAETDRRKEIEWEGLI